MSAKETPLCVPKGFHDPQERNPQIMSLGAYIHIVPSPPESEEKPNFSNVDKVSLGREGKVPGFLPFGVLICISRGKIK